ncbi:PepSY-associated TM helix domain-containing protein [Qipengyuania qiaonensis]|uniref:PepSY domain-containing protein n=1 Tax=Qipengyuania qiaonensis TaxID=2867240 RepID=A0ABS7J9E4_9SPHN|nr:PepSY domain-containing protein [Qipengyuania qiaonensis]MBX7483558.1 PepSY domain-containing protein [Qipengyuania qiaonensis]
MADTATYRTFWRWHFYAGLFVLPFILILSATGAIYLFKPQIDRWEERDYRGLSAEGAVSPDRQLDAALAAYPQGRFNHYRLPENRGDAAMIQLGMPDDRLTEVFVSPQGQVLGTLVPDDRISNVIATFHGSLMLGEWGDRLVELAASWTIVMILTGLYLWWPRPFKAAGTFWPRLSLKGRPLLKDLHRVTGFWIAGLVLVMLASGLPWAGTWGSAFKWARTELGLVQGPQEWKIGAGATVSRNEHAGNWLVPAAQAHGGHNHDEMTDPPATASTTASVGKPLPLALIVAFAEAENMAFPVLVLPPNAPQRFGPPTGNVWTVKSEAQNRPLIRSVTFDPRSGNELSRSNFFDKHPIDRAINYGIAWHEGQLFGLANQLLGLVTALALVGLSILGVTMWLKRRPSGAVGAPLVNERRLGGAIIFAIAVLALMLPLFGLSLIALWLIDRIVALIKR